MADYNIRRIDGKGWVEFDVHAPSLETAIVKFKELEAELDPKPDVHDGEQTLFESVGQPDPTDPPDLHERDAERRIEEQLD